MNPSDPRSPVSPLPCCPPLGRPPPEDLLRSVFGYAQFRPGQRELIDAVLSGRDSIGVMPTGAGKSLTYQIPARILGGTALVVSPLIALMKDQVDALRRRGYRATFINSSLPPEERRARAVGVRRGDFELVYAAPEGLEASVGSVLGDARLSLIAVDEAHCISHWGHDFRPAYRNLAGLKQRFRGVPVLALTATATRRVSVDIAQQLAMDDPFEYRGSFFRPNLQIHVYKKGGDLRSREAILRYVRARPGERGIVYCATRKAVEGLADRLRDDGVRARAYHAGLEPEVRERVQNAFRDDGLDVVVATVAFGMGIDKPDIRYVIHRDMPGSIESYCQEIGRAGRDGNPSDCILFYSWADVITHDRFADRVEDPEAAEQQRKQAREMFRLAESEECRHVLLVRHFGERIAGCGASCDRCSPTPMRESASPPRALSSSAPASQVGGVPPGRAALAGALGAEDSTLFEHLRVLRRDIAEARGVPAYIIFHDSVLRAIAATRPLDGAQLLAIPGVGPRKLAFFGSAVLEIVRRASPRPAPRPVAGAEPRGGVAEPRTAAQATLTAPPPAGAK